MKLSELYIDLLEVNLKITSDSTKKHYNLCIRHLEQCLGEVPTINHLTNRTQTKFARWLQDRGLAPASVNQRLHYLRALWRFACRQNLCDRWPESVSVVEPEKTPDAYSDEELARLWKAIDEAKGSIPFTCSITQEELRIAASKWWRAFFLAVYHTGERCSAVRSIRFDWIRGDYLYVPASVRKGGQKPRVYWICDELAQSIEDIGTPKRELVLPMKPSMYYFRLRKILRAADLRQPRQGAQRMRRTHASLVAKYGGDATKALGHSTSRITERYYLDPGVAEVRQENAVLPAVKARHHE